MIDLISKQEAKEAVCCMCRWEGTENCDECEHPIDDLPTIDPVKHGEWEDGRCTQCGFKSVVNPFDINLDTGERTLILKFCPNCGAKMEEVDDETN